MIKAIMAAAAGLCLTTAANAAVLTFEELGLDNGAYIPQTYGDLANLDLSYTNKESFGNSSVITPELGYWHSDYSDRTGVAYTLYDNSVAEISFTAAAGYVGKISSFYFGKYPGNNINGSFAIYDAGWNVLWSHTESSIWDGGIGMSPDVSFTGTAYLQWGTSFNLGLDELTYSVSAEDVQPAPIPLPAGFPLLAAGLLAFGGLRIGNRRQQS